MISIVFCEKMSHATTRLDVFRRAVVSTPAIFFPRKPALYTFKTLHFSKKWLENLHLGVTYYLLISIYLNIVNYICQLKLLIAAINNQTGKL